LRIKVLIEADYYIPQGKFQGKIIDIDESFTVGEIAITRTKIWERLVSENLSRLNAQLPMPLLPLNIGLVTSESSAAYKDFVSTIKASGFAFSIKTIPAKMQGQNTEADIIEALGKLRECEDLDVVCIIRGGGAKTDLVFFDSYALCRAAALFPLPVLTGIGHEIDESLLDRVAHTRLITPTDCARFLVERVYTAWQRLQTMCYELGGLAWHFTKEKERLDRSVLGLKRGVQKILDYKEQVLMLLEEKVNAANPETQLKRGYTITKSESGKILRSAKEAAACSAFKTMFADGEVASEPRP
jgi:exodeoxyribonuclease VII large subunit